MIAFYKTYLQVNLNVFGKGEDNIDDKYDNNGKYNSKNSDTSSMNVCAL